MADGGLMAENGAVKVTINGKEIQTAPGRMLIDVAEEHDIFVPRFCYHPGLESVAACRMCLVHVDGSRKPLDPACGTPVVDGMVVQTNSAGAVEAQESMLELLLINHPLDCPICDRGGECPLQDQALRFGPGSSRYQEEKRHFPKPIPISDLVMLDRERCVLCWRCVRFCDEISGDTFIDLMDRGSLTQINTAADSTFDSHFSGNTIQICPVGALTSKPYRFLSRPWDILPTESVCSFCSVGCPTSIEQRGGEVIRTQALPNENVNSFWNCDKGRFGHRYVSHPDRLTTPLVRTMGLAGESFVETQWDQALEIVAHRLRTTLDEGGPASVGFIGGSHCTNEDLFATSRFFRETVGTPNLDFRTFDAGFPYEAFAPSGFAGSNATFDDLDRAKTIVWIGPDPKEELPVLYLRIRRAVQGGARLVVLHPRRISLSSLGLQLWPEPGEEASMLRRLLSETSEEAASLGEAFAEGPAVVCVGQQFVGRSMDPAPVLSLLRALPDARLLLCPPNANSQGALDMGISPSLGAGHKGVAEGLGSAAMLEAAANGRLAFLWVMGADLVSDFPDAGLVEAALSSDVFVVVSELFPTETARSADVIFPAASFAEKEGTFTNLERRIQKVNAASPTPGLARADWQIFRDLAGRMKERWGWETAADIGRSIAYLPTHAGLTWDRLSSAPSSMREAVTLPPEVGHATGESGLPQGRMWSEPGHPDSYSPDAPGVASTVPWASESAWPLRWELRAVDATKRSGWIWGGDNPLGEEAQAADETGFVNPASLGSVEEPGPLALLAARCLYDAGQMVSRSPDLSGLAPRPFVEIHPGEAEGRGLTDGEEVTVSNAKGSVRVSLRVSADTPPGAAFMAFDQPGVRASLLMDAGRETFVEVSR